MLDLRCYILHRKSNLVLLISFSEELFPDQSQP